MRKILGASLLTLLTAGAAQAQVVTYEFKAVIDSVKESAPDGTRDVASSTLNGSVIGLGDTITGRFFFDLSTPYNGVSDASYEIGAGAALYEVPHVFPSDPYTREGTSVVFDRTGYAFASDPTQARYIPVLDNAAGAGADRFEIYGHFLAKGREVTYPPQTGDVRFLDSSGTALSGSALPTALNLADWSQATYDYYWAGPDLVNLYVNARITSLAQVSAVPEPATLAMMALGMLLVGAGYRSEKFKGGKAARQG